jgi:signal transduction histidine kinase
VARTPGACRVTVRARRTDDGAVTLSVRDTGPGFDTTDPDAVLARGTGLANVRDRLTRAFDGDADLTIHPDGVTLHLPFQPFAAPPPDARPRHADPARPDRG